MGGLYLNGFLILPMPFAQLMNTDGGKAGVQDQLSQRDALLATLQEQTAQLLLQYQQSSQEVREQGTEQRLTSTVSVLECRWTRDSNWCRV